MFDLQKLKLDIIIASLYKNIIVKTLQNSCFIWSSVKFDFQFAMLFDI